MTLAAAQSTFFAKAKVQLIGGVVVTTLAIAAPFPLAAQSVETKAEPEAGDMVLLRDVPERAGQKEGRGDALVANASPNTAFDDAIALGVNQIDDTDAAAITASVLSDLNNLGMVDSALAGTESLIADAVRDSQSVPFSDPTAAGITSIVNGSVGSAMSSANSATQNALGNLNAALGSLSLGGPGQ